MSLSHSPSRLDVIFDDDHAVANAGLVLTSVLASKLGIETLTDEMVSVGSRPGRKLLSLVQSMVAGGDCIDDVDVLRSGSTESVLDHKAMAPSTCGTFLRSFTFGHVRQLDRLSETAMTRAWALGAGPGDAPMTIDIDSTICEVHGHAKAGAAFGYTQQRGYHPILATRAGTGEVLHVRQRTGSANSARGAVQFVREVIGRVRRAGSTGALTLRADSAFYSAKVIAACVAHDVRFSITINQYANIRAIIAGIDESAWVDIDYRAGGDAQVSETTYGGLRLVVRRTRLVGPQAELWPNWRHHAFVTDRAGSAVELDADHRDHAVVELAIRDLKDGTGANHAPSGRFNANAAWLGIAALAHNLLRWVAALGLDHAGPIVVKTIRRRFIALPGRITTSARRVQLHLPRRWPWRHQMLHAVVSLRRLPRTC